MTIRETQEIKDEVTHQIGDGGSSMVTRDATFVPFPRDAYEGRINVWAEDCRKAFNHTIHTLKEVSAEAVGVTACANKNAISFIEDDIKWCITGKLKISGVVPGYQTGIYSTPDADVHIFTSSDISEDMGIFLQAIIEINRDTGEVQYKPVTIKHEKWDVKLDSSTSPDKIPSIVATQRDTMNIADAKLLRTRFEEMQEIT